MKLISLAALSLFVCLSLVASPIERRGATKITKNEAEHIALRQYPGTHVQRAKLARLDGEPVWQVELADSQSRQRIQVGVDATTGRVAIARQGNGKG